MISTSNSGLTPRLENTTPVVCTPGVTVELEPVFSDGGKNKRTNKQTNKQTKNKMSKLNL